VTLKQDGVNNKKLIQLSGVATILAQLVSELFLMLATYLVPFRLRTEESMNDDGQ